MGPTMGTVKPLQEFLSDPPSATVPSSPLPSDARHWSEMEVKGPWGALSKSQAISVFTLKLLLLEALFKGQPRYVTLCKLVESTDAKIYAQIAR